MDGVILVAIIVPALIALFSMFVHLATSDGGTKGITKKPYTTKSGVKHTAHKSREQHIV
jgi:hypothetical protein